MYQIYKSIWIKSILVLSVFSLAAIAFAQKPFLLSSSQADGDANQVSAEEAVLKEENQEINHIAFEAEAAEEQKPPVPTPPAPKSAPEPPKPPQPQSAQTIKGASLRIDAIKINIPLARTTLGANRELLVPADPNKAAWYVRGPAPGNSGTALITGHLDSNGGRPGVFYNLNKLKPGDVIRVGRDDGKIAVFKVDRLASYKQDHTFPWHLVYSTTGSSGLRIITCDGTYNSKTQRYSHNLVVYASLVSIENV